MSDQPDSEERQNNAQVQLEGGLNREIICYSANLLGEDANNDNLDGHMNGEDADSDHVDVNLTHVCIYMITAPKGEDTTRDLEDARLKRENSHSDHVDANQNGGDANSDHVDENLKT